VMVIEAMGHEEAEEKLARIMGQRGPGVNPADTNWGLSPSAQAGLARMAAMIPSARPVVESPHA
jgi:hypothetical protein